MAVDTFASHSSGLSSPATKHYMVDLESPGPTDLDPKPRFLYVMTDGNVEILDEDDVAVTYPVLAGQVLEFRAKALGGNTTSDIAAWY